MFRQTQQLSLIARQGRRVPEGHNIPTTKNRGQALFSTLQTIPPAAHNLAQASPSSAFTAVPTCSTAPGSHWSITMAHNCANLASWLPAMPILPCASRQPNLKRAHDETPNDGTIIIGAAHCAYTLTRVPQAVRSFKQIAKHDLVG